MPIIFKPHNRSTPPTSLWYFATPLPFSLTHGLLVKFHCFSHLKVHFRLSVKAFRINEQEALHGLAREVHFPAAGVMVEGATPA
jgi:hypothetical protein